MRMPWKEWRKGPEAGDTVLRRGDSQGPRPRVVQENEEQELGGTWEKGGHCSQQIWWPRGGVETEGVKTDLFLGKFSC